MPKYTIEAPTQSKYTIEPPDAPDKEDRSGLNFFRPLSTDERSGIESKIGKYPGAVVEGVGNAAMGALSGLGQMIFHPLSTIYSSAQTAADALNQLFPDVGLNPQQKAAKDASLQRLKTQWEDIKDNPDFAIGNLAGSIEGGKILGEVGGKLTGKLRDTASKARQGVRTMQAKTGTPFIRDVVDKTKETNQKIADKNELATEKATDKNAENAAAHQADVQTALHDTQGREIQHKQELANKAEEIRKQEALEAEKQRLAHEAAARKTAEDNTAALQKAESDYTNAQDDYLRKHAEHQQNTAKTEADNSRMQSEYDSALKSQRELQDHLNKSERIEKTDLKKVEKNVHKSADDKYEALKPKLYTVEADPKTANSIGNNAIDELGDHPAIKKPELLKKYEDYLETNVPTYGGLDSFRSQIAAKLRAGGLSGADYHVYEVMLDGIDGNSGIIGEMTRIAEDHGMAKEATAARSAWRSWAESFRDRTSPLRKVLKDPEEHGLLSDMRGRQSYLQRLRAFGPEGAQLADRISGDLDVAQRTKSTFSKYGQIEVPEPKSPKLGEVKPFAAPEPEFNSPKLKPEPNKPVAQLVSGSPEERAAQQLKQPDRVPIPDRPVEVTPTLKPNEVLTPEKLSDIKRAQAIKAARGVYNSSNHLATVFTVMEGARQLLKGHPGATALDAASRFSYAAWKAAYAEALENPKFLDEVSKVSEADVKAVMKLPADQRAGFENLITEAQAKGAKLKPGVLGAMFGVTAPMVQGSKTRELKKLRDEHAFTDRSDSQQ